MRHGKIILSLQTIRHFPYWSILQEHPMNKPDIPLDKWHSQYPKPRTRITIRGMPVRAFSKRIRFYETRYSVSRIRKSHSQFLGYSNDAVRWPSIFTTFRKTVMYSSLWRNESSLLTTVPGSWFALCECNTRINTANCVSGYSQHGV
jgi:hypothetical protein